MNAIRKAVCVLIMFGFMVSLALAGDKVMPPSAESFQLFMAELQKSMLTLAPADIMDQSKQATVIKSAMEKNGWDLDATYIDYSKKTKNGKAGLIENAVMGQFLMFANQQPYCNALSDEAKGTKKDPIGIIAETQVSEQPSDVSVVSEKTDEEKQEDERNQQLIQERIAIKMAADQKMNADHARRQQVAASNEEFRIKNQAAKVEQEKKDKKLKEELEAREAAEAKEKEAAAKDREQKIAAANAQKNVAAVRPNNEVVTGDTSEQLADVKVALNDKQNNANNVSIPMKDNKETPSGFKKVINAFAGDKVMPADEKSFKILGAEIENQRNNLTIADIENEAKQAQVLKDAMIAHGWDLDATYLAFYSKLTERTATVGETPVMGGFMMIANRPPFNLALSEETKAVVERAREKERAIEEEKTAANRAKEEEKKAAMIEIEKKKAAVKKQQDYEDTLNKLSFGTNLFSCSPVDDEVFGIKLGELTIDFYKRFYALTNTGLSSIEFYPDYFNNVVFAPEKYLDTKNGAEEDEYRYILSMAIEKGNIGNSIYKFELDSSRIKSKAVSSVTVVSVLGRIALIEFSINHSQMTDNNDSNMVLNNIVTKLTGHDFNSVWNSYRLINAKGVKVGIDNHSIVHVDYLSSVVAKILEDAQLKAKKEAEEKAKALSDI